MNRIEKRLADGPRPGVAVCSMPGKAVMDNGRTMLGSSSSLYNSSTRKQYIRQPSHFKPREDRLKRLEIKLQQVEKNQSLSKSDIESKLSQNENNIDLMRGEYKGQIKAMKEYIQTLELKINQLDQLLRGK